MTSRPRPLSERWPFVEWLDVVPHRRYGLRILQSAIGLMFLFKVLTAWSFAAYLWGPAGIGAGTSIATAPQLFGRWIAPIADRAFATDAGTRLVLVALGLGAMGLLAGRCVRASIALALLCSVALDSRLPILPDGGDNITRLVLIYMLFTISPAASPRPRSLAVWLHNVAVVAIVVQTAVLYFTAGLAKAYGDMWEHGVALYYISQVSIFSSPAMASLFRSPLTVTLGTYLVMFWELMAPVAAVSRLRWAWIGVGILFELGVACFMGLLTFSTVMIGLLLFIVDDDEYLRMAHAIAGRLPAWRRRSHERAVARLYLDGDCPTCRIVGGIIGAVDRTHQIQLTSFRTDASYAAFGLSGENLEARMHLVMLDGSRTTGGFEAARALARAVPALAILRPVFWVLAALGVGDALYDFFASRRITAGAAARRVR